MAVETRHGGRSFEKVLALVSDPHTYFDGRAHNAASSDEVLQNLVWRSCYDCRRNSVSGLARFALGKRAVHGVGTKRLLQLLEEAGAPWDAMPPHFRFGTFIKKRRVLRAGVDKRSGKKVDVWRSVPCATSFDINPDAATPDAIPATVSAEALLAKYWPETFLERPAVASAVDATTLS